MTSEYIEKDLKAKVKAANEGLPSYKAVTKTTVRYEPIDHSVGDSYFEIQW